MEDEFLIMPPRNGEDWEGAQRVFEEFFILYQPALSSVQHYLAQVTEEMGAEYAAAYRPWQSALSDLFQGVYLTAKKIPLPDPEGFLEALRMFSFESAVQFLSDLCISCRLVMRRDWQKRFREHIEMLMVAFSVLNRQTELSRGR